MEVRPGAGWGGPADREGSQVRAAAPQLWRPPWAPRLPPSFPPSRPAAQPEVQPIADGWDSNLRLFLLAVVFVLIGCLNVGCGCYLVLSQGFFPILNTQCWIRV